MPKHEQPKLSASVFNFRQLPSSIFLVNGVQLYGRILLLMRQRGTSASNLELKMASLAIVRAVVGYLFLIALVRVVGRKPGQQLTPFEFVLIFYLGGLTLTGIVGDEASLSSAVCQILTVGLCHYVLSLLRYHSTTAQRLLDGVPLLLLDKGRWRSESMHGQRITDDDVMDMARAEGLRSLDKINIAVLETDGGISVVPIPPPHIKEEA